LAGDELDAAMQQVDIEEVVYDQPAAPSQGEPRLGLCDSVCV
jgi:hypothetical protein